MLEVKNLNSYYGKSHILRDVSLSVQKSEIVGILGRNGVGKTTLLRSIVGLVSDISGDIILQNDGKNESIKSLSPDALVQKGIVYVRESRMIFGSLTVADNLRLTGGDIAEVYDLFPRLFERQQHLGSELSGGEQKILALARSLLMRPKFLLLDEIGEGLSPIILQQVKDILARLVEMNVGILLVEQNLSFGLSVMHRTYVLGMGEVRFAGSAKELNDNKTLQKKLLSV